jgi:hypothetical protein
MTDFAQTIDYAWKDLPLSGVFPAVRYNTAPFMYNGGLWMIMGAGAGVGRAASVWRFDIEKKEWNEIRTKGDVPAGRDGHSATYIGNGKYVIFGGQGVSRENDKKAEKVTEVMKIKTYDIREVYNSLYEFNCDTCTWRLVVPDGPSVPLGRRGHVATYVVNSGRRDNTNMPPRTGRETAISYIPRNSLLVFGGAGVESSKYTEIYFNDLWSFSFDDHHWMRLTTNGIEPRPVFDHKAEFIDIDTLLVVGGMTTSASPIRALERIGTAVPIVSSVMTLQLSTLTWRHIECYDILGRPAPLTIYGHSLVHEPPFATQYEEAHEKEDHILFIFGGREVVETKNIMNRKTPAAVKRTMLTPRFPAWRLDIPKAGGRGTLRVLDAKGDIPVNRYGHVGISLEASVLDTHIQKNLNVSYNLSKNEQIFQSGISEFKAIGYENSLSTQRHNEKKIVKEKQIKEKKAVLPDSLKPHETFVMAIFGGCETDKFGFCKPIVHILTRISHWVSGEESNANDKFSHLEKEKATKQRYFMKLSPQKSIKVEDDADYNPQFDPKKKTLNDFKKTDVYGKFGKLPENFADFKMALAESVHEKQSCSIVDAQTRGMLAHSSSMRGFSKSSSVRGFTGSMATASSGGTVSTADSSMMGQLNQERATSSQKTELDMNYDAKREHRKRIRVLSREILPKIVGTDKANRHSYATLQEQYLRSLPPPMLLDGSQTLKKTPILVSANIYDPATSLSGPLPQRIHSSSRGN